uniref:Uncharacterized protein n=1 Tax=Mus musculus TaxID=10090 RepID=Q3UUX0_MOUSE|nr:unnamed protein product [Mus musculus]
MQTDRRELCSLVIFLISYWNFVGKGCCIIIPLRKVTWTDITQVRSSSCVTLSVIPSWPQEVGEDVLTDVPALWTSLMLRSASLGVSTKPSCSFIDRSGNAGTLWQGSAVYS